MILAQTDPVPDMNTFENPKASQGSVFELLVTPEDERKRIDVFLCTNLDCSRNFASNLVSDKKVFVNGENVKASYKIKINDKISGRVPKIRPIIPKPENLSLDIIYDDKYISIINKPPKMVVHPAPGHLSSTLVNGILYEFENMDFSFNSLRPGIVHRLDKDTSGAIVIAKTQKIQKELEQSFKNREVVKKYFVLVHGNPPEKFIVEKPIGRHLTKRKKMSVSFENGRDALSYFKVINCFGDISLLEADIITGRTHQIRVHLSSEGFPVLGDELYGYKHPMKHLSDKSRAIVKKHLSRQMLHSAFLSFNHPYTKEKVSFEADFFEDMKKIISELKT